MRIDSGLIPDARIEATYPKKTDSKPITEIPTAPAHDTLTLSGSVQLAHKLESQVGEMPEVRMKRVADLRSAIETGEWSVTPDQIAGAMYREIASLDRFNR